MVEYFETGTSLEFLCAARVIQNFPIFYSDKFKAQFEITLTKLSRVNLPIFVFINENQDRVWKETLDEHEFEPIYIGCNSVHKHQIILYVRDKNYD